MIKKMFRDLESVSELIKLEIHPSQNTNYKRLNLSVKILHIHNHDL